MAESYILQPLEWKKSNLSYKYPENHMYMILPTKVMLVNYYISVIWSKSCETIETTSYKSHRLFIPIQSINRYSAFE